MPAYILGPGAWLSGNGYSGAELNPPIKGNSVQRTRGLRGALLNPNPGVNDESSSGWNPNPRPGYRALSRLMPNPDPPLEAGALNRLDRPGMPDGTDGSVSAWPWQGIDPDWVYEGGDEALLAQALRRMRAKVVRPVDPRNPPPSHAGVKSHSPRLPPGDPIWRWGSEFRIRAAVADLSGRFFVEDRAMYALMRGGGKSPTVTCLPIITINNLSGDAAWGLQIDKVQRAAVEREDRLPEILTQATNFWPFFNAVTGIDALYAPRTTELFEVAWQWADQIVMAFKNQIAAPRPVQRSAAVSPVIATPRHGSLPSGHATFAALTSELFIALMWDAKSERAAQLDRLARRIAFNRVVAGVHFPVDSAAGYLLGLHLAACFTALGSAGKSIPELFEFAPGAPKSKHGKWLELPESLGRLVLESTRDFKSASPIVSTLWTAAQRELDQLRT